VPITGFASSAVWFILLGGFFLSMLNVISPPVFGKFLGVAVGLFSVVTFFQLITLPVEFDASRRARERLVALGLVRGNEISGVSRVLNAAAMTYVAAMVAAALQLLRLILMARHMNNR
jgi:Zn-dependent membrane protease YugP